MTIKSEIGYSQRFWPLVTLGGLLGYLFCGDYTGFLESPPRLIASSFAVGLVWAYIFLQCMDLLAEAMALRDDPLPDTLNIADRGSLRGQLVKLAEGSSISMRARRLIEAWSLGWNPQQVIELATLQSARAQSAANSGAFFAILLLVFSLGLNGDLWLTSGGLALLGLTLFVRKVLSHRIDNYIEGNLLIRLPANIPQTAMTAAELAGELGGAINKAFKDYVPQPEQAAQAMKKAMEGIISSSASEVEKLQKLLVESQAKLIEKWMAAATTTTTDLKNTEKALATLVTDLTNGLSTNAEKMKLMLGAHTKDTEKALATVVTDMTSGLSTNAEKVKSMLGAHAQDLEKAMSAAPANIKTVLTEHNEKFQAVNQGLIAQLGKIAELEKDIQNILHLQETVEGTLKGVAASTDFKQMVASIKTHLEESDKLMQEMSKPKTIRLVESETE